MSKKATIKVFLIDDIYNLLLNPIFYERCLMDMKIKNPMREPGNKQPIRTDKISKWLLLVWTFWFFAGTSLYIVSVNISGFSRFVEILTIFTLYPMYIRLCIVALMIIFSIYSLINKIGSRFQSILFTCFGISIPFIEFLSLIIYMRP